MSQEARIRVRLRPVCIRTGNIISLRAFVRTIPAIQR